MNRVYIVGAHSRGITMGHYLQFLNPHLVIKAYLYNNDDDNPGDVNGIPVVKFDEHSDLDVNVPVYIATRSVFHQSISTVLTMCGMKQIIPVDYQFDLVIRNQYLRKYFKSIGKEYTKIDDLFFTQQISRSSVCVFVANTIFDKPLRCEYQLAEYERRIQVGAALADTYIHNAVLDNNGENISRLNRQFCELTGMYWMWKNAMEDIVGLVHYRRHFILPESWQIRIEEHNVDVILPVPLYVSPSIEGNYRSRHIESVWEYMIDYFKVNIPEEYDNIKSFFRTNSLYSPCNMFIMKKEVLNELCQWLFPILFDVSKKSGNFDDPYQNRYPGFISERLITYFFARNCDRYKVVYADKNFLQ